jgi:hypothetical protein
MVGIFFGLYVLLSATLLFLRYGKSPKDWLLRFVLVTALPIVGWLFPLFWPKVLRVDPDEEFDDYITRQQEEHKLRRHIGVYSQVETEKELSVIPIEDALLISEHQTRRRVMIDILKQDANHYLEILQRAVSNEDTETSHYAVSAIMEVKRKMLLALQDLSVQYEKNKKNEYLVRTYAEVLKGFMSSGFLDKRTLLKHRHTYLSVLETLTDLTENSEWAYHEKVNVEIELGMFAEAEATSLRYIETHPLSEDAYLCLLKVYFMTKSIVKLYETLDRLKKTPMRLSNQALTLVRFWSEGA